MINASDLIIASRAITLFPAGYVFVSMLFNFIEKRKLHNGLYETRLILTMLSTALLFENFAYIMLWVAQRQLHIQATNSLGFYAWGILLTRLLYLFVIVRLYRYFHNKS